MALQSILSLAILLAMVSLNGALRTGSVNDDLVRRFASRLGLTKFEWHDCGCETTLLKVENFSLTPDPVKAPGKAAMSFQTKLNGLVSAPLKVEIHMEKKFFITWVTLPCEKGFGSCSYDDICPLLEKIVCDEDNKADLTCHCPFKKGKYDLKPTSIDIDEKLIPFPWALVHGEYRVDIKASGSTGQVACLHFQFTLV